MHIQSALYSRSSGGSGDGDGGIGENTIIFIVLGVVCLLVILVGFYLVSRPRAAACNAGPNTPSLHQHSPIANSPRPRCERDKGEHRKFWKIWRHTTGPHSATAHSPTAQLSGLPPITKPSQVVRIARAGSKSSKSDPQTPTTSRPSQSRRVTSLSVATSFPHSHITDEALSDLRASAYDLDGDLETEMLHSARDDVWPSHPLALEEGCEDAGGSQEEAQGSVRGDVPTRQTAAHWGGNYDNVGACRSMASGVSHDSAERDVTAIEVVVVP